VASAGGCGTPEATSHRQTPSPPFPEPSGVTTPTAISPEQTLECEPRQSLRPDGPLPPPGEMAAGSTMAEIHRRGRLIVGIGSNAYLLSFRDPYTGKIRGFEAEIVREVAFAIFGDRDRIQFKVFDLEGRFQAVKDKTVDMVIAATTMTCERWLDVAFSVDYYFGGQQVLVRKNSPFQRIEDLGGKKVCASSASKINLQAIASVRSKPVPVGAANTADCMLLLQQGQVDAVSTGSLILAGLAAQDPATHIVGPKFTDAPTGILMSHGHHDLVRFVNAVLEKLMSDGTWSRFYQTWLESQIGPAEPPIPQYRKE
jgi:polar amino acid transport system substrate-binding protein